QIAHLWWLFFWVCAAVYVVVIGFVLLAIGRGRRRLAAEASEEHDHRAGSIIAGAAGVVVALLLMLLIVDGATGRAIGHFADGDPRTLEIDVTGHQWWWEVKYPNRLVPAYQITTANEIHIPVHTPVLLRVDTR